MSRLDRLTPAQLARFPEFVEKWTKIGLCTDPADRPRAEAAIRWMYHHANLPPPRIVWTGSPFANALTKTITQNIAMQKNPNTKDSVGDSVRDSVRASVWASVRASVGASVWASVGDSVWASVGDSVRASVRDSVGDSVRDSIFGQHDAHWLGFYDFFHTVCHLRQLTKPLQGLWELSQSANWALPYMDICWVAERPQILHQSGTRLHREGGMALQYPDGWGLHALWGVRVEPWMAETPAEQLDVERVLHVTNVEQRTALIKRLGIERLLQQGAATTLDTWHDYSLLDVSLNGGPCRYLKMKNPSLGVWHVEGVPNTCRTVADALHARKPAALARIPIDEECGEAWYEQGDVCIWPKGATAVKRYPLVLT